MKLQGGVLSERGDRREEMVLGSCSQGTSKYYMLECLLFGEAPRACRGHRFISPEGAIGCKIALTRPHLVNSAYEKLRKLHEGVRKQRKGVGVVVQRESRRMPMGEKGFLQFSFESGL